MPRFLFYFFILGIEPWGMLGVYSTTKLHPQTQTHSVQKGFIWAS